MHLRLMARHKAQYRRKKAPCASGRNAWGQHSNTTGRIDKGSQGRQVPSGNVASERGKEKFNG
jgi:hypothetical protein